MALVYKNFFPRLFVRRIIGLHIDDHSIRFAEVKGSKNKARLGVFGEEELPSGIISSGIIQDGKKLEKILRTLRKRIGVKFINVSVPGEQVSFFKIRLPRVKKRRLNKAINAKIKEYIPDLKKFVLDYTIIKEEKDGYEIQAYVIPKALIKKYLEVFRKAGFVPLSFEIDTLALARAVVPQDEKRPYFIINFGPTKTTLSIISDGAPCFFLTSPIGASSVTHEVKEKFDLSYEVAEILKEGHKLTLNADNKKLSRALFEPIARLADEIQKQYINWHLTLDAEGKKRGQIQKIIVCGDDSYLPGLVDYLKTRLRSNVELANVWGNINSSDSYIPEMPYNDSLRFTTALGLALGRFRK